MTEDITPRVTSGRFNEGRRVEAKRKNAKDNKGFTLKKATDPDFSKRA